MAILKLPFFSKQPEVKPWSYPEEKHERITDYLYGREVNLNSPYIPRNYSKYISSKIPQLIQESEINMENHDKIFSSHWISYDEVVIGTKCNKLLILNIQNNKRFEIPLVTEEDRINNNNNINNNNSIISNIISTINSSNNSNITTITANNNNNNQDNGNCSGIRSIAVNPSKTLLAVGAGKPYQVTIYELPSFDPVAVFAGHNDLVFSVEWLDDDHVVSGSRDGTIRLWSIQSKIVSELPILPNKYINVHQSLLARSGNIGKVRDLKYNPKTEQIMTLSTAGYVKIWDSSYLNRIAKIQLNHTNENVCLSMNPKLSLYAVGSQSHVSILDPRISSSIVHEIDSVDEGWGVRSLNFNDHMITIGGGYGRLSFYDLRAQRYLEFHSINTNDDLNIYQQDYYDDNNSITNVNNISNINDTNNNSDDINNNNNNSNDDDNNNNENSVVRNYREIGSGWLNRDAVYINHFSGSSIQNAIYTLSYDESGTKLFSGGGPLHLGLKGSYAALWA